MWDLWKHFLNFININSPLWNFFVTLATIVYVILTFILIKEAIKSRESQSRPYVIVDLIITGITLKLNVQNIGNESAHNINIEIEPNINNPFKSIEFLSPERQVSSIIKHMAYDERESEKQIKYKMSISYKNASSKFFSSEYEIDLSPMLNSLNYRDNEYRDITDKLDKLISKIDDIKSPITKASENLGKCADMLRDISRKK